MFGSETSERYIDCCDAIGCTECCDVKGCIECCDAMGCWVADSVNPALLLSNGG